MTEKPQHAPGRQFFAPLVVALLASVLGACGGGAGGGGSSGGGTTTTTTPVSAPPLTPSPVVPPITPPAVPTPELRLDVPSAVSPPNPGETTRMQAARFLTQTTFGPTEADITAVVNDGYTAWFNAQVAKPSASHRLAFEAADNAALPGNVFIEALNFTFWTQAISGENQLRQRVAFAYSQIFVISVSEGVANVRNNPHGVAAYLDLLTTHAFGNYRTLIKEVSLNPMMATFLSSLSNQKADATGRIPDENYAREVMQLFSIGLWQLNLDGSQKLDGDGNPIPTYSPADVAGMARVFTGWHMGCSNCAFNSTPGYRTVLQKGHDWWQLVASALFHSPETKSFLGVTIPANTSAEATMEIAMDTLFNHPNVGPFIGKQLIQRLVTSNPSPAYVATVAAKFNNNGSGVRGDMRAVIYAILMHPEAAQMSDTSGKLREPILKLSALLRAANTSSVSGQYKINQTQNAHDGLAQAPMESPGVFNFYRPGYVPPGTLAAAAGKVVPEMQIVHETSVAAYVNFMTDVLWDGEAGVMNDVRLAWPDLDALAGDHTALVQRVNEKLMYGTMPTTLKTAIKTALDTARTGGMSATNRARAAVYLTVVSPAYQVQK